MLAVYQTQKMEMQDEFAHYRDVNRSPGLADIVGSPSSEDSRSDSNMSSRDHQSDYSDPEHPFGHEEEDEYR